MGSSTSKHKTKAYKLHHSYSSGRPLPPGKPTLKYDPENVDPDTVTIKWDPPTFNGGSKITGYLVEHKRTGSPHWVKASPIKVSHTQLTVCGLEPGWRYQFRVTAENDFGLSDPSPLSEPLAIFVHRSAAIAPYFVTELYDLVVLENEKVEFTVTFEGIPLPKISWYKDGLEIFSNRCQKISTEGCASTLLIYEAAISDESEIKCSATNRVGYAVTRAYLKVEAPPTIRLPRQYEDGLIFENGETVRLKVSVVGQPVPSVMWFLNGAEISSTFKYEMDYIDKTASLKIKNAERCDRGEYQIQASNIIGEDLASILVTIATRPQPPMNVQVERILGRSLTLSWSSPEDDGGCKIGCYIIEYYKTSWDVWLKAITSRQLRITLDNLIEGSEYKFRVKAENPYGISDPSLETEIIFIPDPKRGIFDPSQATHDADSFIFESVLELEVPQTTHYHNRSTPVRDRLGIDSISSVNRYFGDSQTETDGSSENLDRRKYSPVKPARKHNRKAKPEQPTINNDLLNLPEDDYHFHQSMSNSSMLSVDRALTPSPQPSISVDDTSRTSSELMLVLVPSMEDVANPRASSLTHEFGKNQRGHYDLHGTPPPISLSAPELGSEMELFKPLQRNCVSSTEILHESTIARFYKQLKEEDAAARLNETFNEPEAPSLVDNFSQTSQLLVNRLQKNQAKIYSMADLNCSDVVTDLRKIDNYTEDEITLAEPFAKPSEMHADEMMSSYDSNAPENRYEKTDSLRRSRVRQKLASSLERTLSSPANTCVTQPPPPCQTNSILTVEPHPQGRYSPRSGTFHYPDLFMESLTKSPKFKTTCGSLSEVVAELISKKSSAANAYPAAPDQRSTASDPEARNGSIRERWAATNRPPSSGARPNLLPEIRTWPADNTAAVEDKDSDQTDSDQFDDDSDDSLDDLNDNETDTYHPSECSAPLSFEQALAISNPKRSVSPTNDLFLESETPFYADDVEPDHGLHYFNRNYAETEAAGRRQTGTPKSFVVGGEHKLLKPILKHSCYEERPGPANGAAGQQTVDAADAADAAAAAAHDQSYLAAWVQRRDSRSPKKHVRIEEPTKGCGESQPKADELDTSLVIINHYSDIVKQFGTAQRPPVKVYMTYDELKAAAQQAECENMDDVSVECDECVAVFAGAETEADEVRRDTVRTSPAASSLVQVQGQSHTEKVKRRVHFLFAFCLDFFMFVFACWVYCFKDERLAIPIIVLMVYRQLYDKIREKMPKFDFWKKRKPS